MAAQVTRNAVIAWLLFAAACLADKLPSAAIDFRASPQHQRRHHDEKHDGTGEAVYGPLVPRILGTHNQSQIFGRAEPGEPGEDGYGPLMSVPGCLWCPEQNVAAGTGRALLASLTTQKMQSYMRIGSPSDLENKCVFYSKAVNQPPQYLSKDASVWACKHSKLSIWVRSGFTARTAINCSDLSPQPAPVAQQVHGKPGQQVQRLLRRP